MKKLNASKYINLFFLSVAVYFFADVPVQLTAFLPFGPHIGIKNFLPPVLGMQFGFFGVAGSVAATILAGIIMKTSVSYVLLECVCNIIIGTGTWILWHVFSKTHRTHFKKIENILCYVAILVSLSVTCGVISFVFIGGDFFSVFISYTAFGVLVGVPVNILANGIFCYRPVLPPFAKVNNDVTGIITRDFKSLCMVNDMLEELATDKKISRKRMFEIQSCLEELTIRIFNVLPEVQVKILVDYDDSISMKFSYPGKKYNPLHIGKNEDEIDMISLILVKHRALRAVYRYSKNENQIHIVV